MQVTSRRSFLRNASALLASATTVGFSGIFGLRTAAAQQGDDVKTMIDVAATAETFACTHYYRAMKSGIEFTTPEMAYIKAALEQELIHLEFLEANGAASLASEFYFPEGTFDNAQVFGAVTILAETVFVGAYLAATRRLAELGNPLMAATAAQIAVVEGMHLALVRQTASELPNNIPYGEPVFYNVSDAVAVVKPLLDGVEGDLGPMEKEAVPFPGAEAIRKAIGRSEVVAVKTFVDPDAFPGMMQPTAEATAEATPEGTPE